jgi:phosphoribosylamine--glycine ligase
MTDRLNVLLIGGGGREHALAWALRRSPRLANLIIAPGNAGTAALGENLAVAADDLDGLVALARDRAVDLAVVGPEAPLAAGLVDALAEAGVRAFGPSRAAAQLEASKAFAKTFMRDHGIPNAAYASFDDYAAARAYLDTCAHPVVVKADGLAAGKGVIVCDDHAEAEAALRRILLDGEFGRAGALAVIETRLTGPEVSLMAFCDGATVVPMLPARDHKRVFDGDQGPNTGGMGAFAPVPGLPADFAAALTEAVLRPAVAGMAARGTPYRGVLYAGLMLTPDGPMTLEFNCRFGDPETQAVLPLLDADLLTIMLACVDGALTPDLIRWRAGACATVVAAAPGYPGDYRKGLAIRGLGEAEAPGRTIFHAGTMLSADGAVVTSGGRVLSVSAVADDLAAALESAYAGLRALNFEGMHYRRDIGQTG